MYAKEFIKYVLDSYNMIYQLLGLLVILLISVHISNRVKRLTLVVVVLLFAELFAFNLEKWTQTFEKLSMLRPMLTAVVYSMYPLILICIMQITVRERISPRMFMALLIPEILSIPLFITSQWTHLVCWFSEDNHYQGGSLSYWPYVLFGYYIAVFLFQNFRYFSKYSRIDRLVISYIVSGAVAGVIYYIAAANHKDYSTIFTDSIMLYYIYIYIHMAKVDPLTGLLNRQSYYQDMQMNAKSITCVVSADMNNLKELNDAYGHETGDKALVSAASVLRDYSGNSEHLYRIGGDEFILFYMDRDEQTVVDAIAKMREKMAETICSCAFGYAMHDQDSSLADTVAEADRRMYEDKAAIKGALAGARAAAE